MNPARTAYWKQVAGEGETDERWHVVAAACAAFLDQRSEEAGRRMEELRPEYQAAKAAEAVRDHTTVAVCIERHLGLARWVAAPWRQPWDTNWLADLGHNERRRTA